MNEKLLQEINWLMERKVSSKNLKTLHEIANRHRVGFFSAQMLHCCRMRWEKWTKWSEWLIISVYLIHFPHKISKWVTILIFHLPALEFISIQRDWDNKLAWLGFLIVHRYTLSFNSEPKRQPHANRYRYTYVSSIAHGYAVCHFGISW